MLFASAFLTMKAVLVHLFHDKVILPNDESFLVVDTREILVETSFAARSGRTRADFNEKYVLPNISRNRRRFNKNCNVDVINRSQSVSTFDFSSLDTYISRREENVYAK